MKQSVVSIRKCVKNDTTLNDVTVGAAMTKS